ncbi:hypothetical protein, partial [Stutzerimonas stutzeri]|uniref:hypothetical protein n=1 Tax=Stutzerimonas stutzeri TaxID=316 RepID=UPI0024B6E922
WPSSSRAQVIATVAVMVILKLPSLGREARNKKGVRSACVHAVEDAFVCADTFVGSAYPAKQAACQFRA